MAAPDLYGDWVCFRQRRIRIPTKSPPRRNAKPTPNCHQVAMPSPHPVATKSQCQAHIRSPPNRTPPSRHQVAMPSPHPIATKSQCQATPNRARQIATTTSQPASRARRSQCQATIVRGLIFCSALPKILTSIHAASALGSDGDEDEVELRFPCEALENIA